MTSTNCSLWYPCIHNRYLVGLMEKPLRNSFDSYLYFFIFDFFLYTVHIYITSKRSVYIYHMRN